MVTFRAAFVSAACREWDLAAAAEAGRRGIAYLRFPTARTRRLAHDSSDAGSLRLL